jgi:opacity protein-like surface antigen
MRLLTCMLVVLVLVGSAAAATVPTSKGDKAMMFMFYGLGDLDLDGYGHSYGVGMRYYIADMSAIRAGITFGQDSWTEKAVDEGDQDLENKHSSIGFELTYEKHLEAPCPSISPYIGAGAGYSRWKSEDENFNYGGRAVPVLIEQETDLSVHAVAGFEWGFTDCMTLGGEYKLGWESDTYKAEYDSGEGATITLEEDDYSTMGFGTAAVYLSIYW